MKQKLHCKSIFLLTLLFALFTSKDTTAQTLSININGTNVSCNGNNDGAASAVVSGGSAPYTYLWTNSSSTPGTATISAQKDNSIFEENTSNSNGAGEYFIAGTTAAFFKHRALISFDITQFIPTGAVITNAQLSLHLSQTSSSAGPQSHSLYKLLQNWGEGNSNAGGSPGRGAPAGTNDATWVNTFFPSSTWTNAGATFNISASGAAIVDAPGFYNWTSPGMVADIQTWLDAPSSNFGWLMKSNETSSSQAKRYDSKENATPANRPVLTVGYVSNIIGSSAGITNLPPGTYTVTVTDAQGIIANKSVTISEPAALPAIITDTSVCGSFTWPVNGHIYSSSINDTIVTGCQTYILNLIITALDTVNQTITACNTYTWPVNGQTYTASGIYTSINSCIQNVLNLTINSITINVSTGTIACNGGKTSATIIATGGTAPYTYSINGTAPQNNNTFNNIKAGNYSILVTDVNGCSGTKSFTVSQPARLKLIVGNKIKPSCTGGSDGSIQVNASGGTSPYQFNVNGGTFTSNSIFSNLSAGTYSFSVKDANGCIISKPITLNDGRGACINTGIIANENKQNYILTTGTLKRLSINVLPNPSNTCFTLTLQSDSKVAIQVIVTDIYGKNVYETKGNNTFYIFGENFARGIYIVKVIQGNSILTQKIIKG